MNALARNDLKRAFESVKAIEIERILDDDELCALRDAVEKLCHVCQALREENEELRQRLDQCFNVNAAATDAIRDRLSNVSAELTRHTNTQDAHNI